MNVLFAISRQREKCGIHKRNLFLNNTAIGAATMPQLSSLRSAVLPLLGLPLLHRGKVRDTYDLGNNTLLVVATDGISIFDFVLNALIPEKGMVLNVMNHAWLSMLETSGMSTHLIAAGAAIDDYLPAHLRGNPDLQSRAMVVKKLTMHPVEFIIRGYLTGTGLGEYNKTRSVCGHRLRAGYRDGDRLDTAIDTPTTKAPEGHDKPLDAQRIRTQYPQETAIAFKIFQIISEYANSHGIILADTKEELGIDKNGAVTVGDEVGTPDSSRFWDRFAWYVSRIGTEGCRAPPPLDKQLMRAWGIEHGVHKRDPLNPDDVAYVHALSVPEKLIGATTQTYRYIFWRLFSQTVEDYLRNVLDVEVYTKKKRLAIVLGSEGDIPAVLPTLRKLCAGGDLCNIFDREPTVSIISCHRNPATLALFAQSVCGGVDVVLAAGGKAFALPGVLDAFLYHYGHTIPVVGVALGEENSRAQLAARLSIEEIPGEMVVLNEVGKERRAYRGADGFYKALMRIAQGELPPLRERAYKPERLFQSIESLIARLA